MTCPHDYYGLKWAECPRCVKSERDALRAEVERLAHELKVARSVQATCYTHGETLARLAASEAQDEVKGLRRLLKRYQQHRRRAARAKLVKRAQWRELGARAEQMTALARRLAEALVEEEFRTGELREPMRAALREAREAGILG